MSADWIVKALICKLYRRYPERFTGSIGFFSLMQGGRNTARSEEAALTGGRSALQRLRRIFPCPGGKPDES
jgi:hypothetical protein